MRLARILLVLALAQAALAWTNPASPAAGEPSDSERARLLLIDLDDLGYDLLRETPTPNLDWIEANGRFFLDFTTSPVCSPTRAMVQTGAYPSHPDVLVGANVGVNESIGLPLAPLEPLAAVVAASGRTTAKVGKWHLAPADDPDHVRRAGWEHYAGVLSNVTGGETYSNFTKVIDGEARSVTGRYLTSDETDDGIRCVLAGVDLVSVSYHAPHTPYHEPPADLHSEADLSTDRGLARAMLQACDTELGRLVAFALDRDYLVIVFSDNGTSQSIGGDKGRLLDGGIVVPFWVIGAGVEPGYDSTRVGAQDLYATVADLFDIDAGPPARGPHSRSFLPEIRGAPGSRRWTYSERFPDVGIDPRSGSGVWRRAVRGSRYKLIHDPNPMGERLIDLWNNPNETVDLLDGPALSPGAAAALELYRRILRRL